MASEAEIMIAKVKAAVDAYNPAKVTHYWIIQYTALSDGKIVIHAYAYKSLDEARRVATELERDKVAQFGAQVSGVRLA